MVAYGRGKLDDFITRGSKVSLGDLDAVDIRSTGLRCWKLTETSGQTPSAQMFGISC